MNDMNKNFKLANAPGVQGMKPLALACAVLLLSACSTLPNDVPGPAVEIATSPTANVNQPIATYKVDGKVINSSANFIAGEGLLPFESSQSGFLSQILALRESYAKRHHQLQAEMDVSSSMQFFGVLGAAAGIATKGRDIRNTGAIVGGLPDFWANHYQVATQALNYRAAIDALDCIYRADTSVPANYWNDLYENGVLVRKDLYTKLFQGDTDAMNGYQTLVDMYWILNQAVYAVDKNLRSLQSKVVVGTVKVSDIQNAITTAVDVNMQVKAVTSAVATPSTDVPAKPSDKPDAPANATSAATSSLLAMRTRTLDALVGKPDQRDEPAKKVLQHIQTANGSFNGGEIAQIIKVKAAVQACVVTVGTP